MKLLKALKRIPYWYLLILPYAAVYFGMGLNQLALAVNHEQMPVAFPASEYHQVCDDPTTLMQNGDTVHSCMNEHTRLRFLCDWIVIGNPQADYIMSPGDIFIFLYEASMPLFLYLWIALIIRDLLGGKRELVEETISDSRSGASTSGLSGDNSRTPRGLEEPRSQPLLVPYIGPSPATATFPGDQAQANSVRQD